MNLLRRRMLHCASCCGCSCASSPPQSQHAAFSPGLMHSRQHHDISNTWRVSPLYVRRYICTKQKVRNAYLYSTDRKMRMKCCVQIRRALSPLEREGPLYRTPICSASRLLNDQPRTLCSPSPRGERDGLPAGPGLPHGDSTGDDD